MIRVIPVFALAFGIFWSTASAERLVIISDLNGGYGSAEYNTRVDRAVERIVELKPAAVLVAGDMIAGQAVPALSAQQLERMWAAFNDTVADPLADAGIPLLITPGNHDASAYPGFEVDRKQYLRQWQQRRPQLELEAGSEWPWFYGARIGDVLVVSIDGTRAGPLSAPAIKRLETMLQGRQATSTVLLAHLPLWPLAQQRQRDIIDDPSLRALLAEQNVDFFVSGHHHAFYPGSYQHTTHLGVGPLGGNVRTLVGAAARQPFSFAILDICHGGHSLLALGAPDYDRPLAIELLPPRIAAPWGELRRSELPAADLKASCRAVVAGVRSAG